MFFTRTNRVSVRFVAVITLTSLLLSAFPASFFVTEAAVIGTVTVEVVPNPSGTDSEGESVTFSHTGPAGVSLTGWSMENAGGLSIDYSFPAVSLAPGDTFKVCSPSNVDASCDDNWTSGSFTNGGDTLSVFAPGMPEAVFSLTYETASDDEVISQTVPVLTGDEDVVICEVSDVEGFAADQEPVAGIVSGADITVEDVVPPFFYFIDLGNFGFFEGQNFDTAGQELLAAGCVSEEEEPEEVQSEETVVVTGDDFVLEAGGWLFNRDSTTVFEFNNDMASIGDGSLYVGPVSSVPADKFIGENFVQTPVADVNSFSYDFKIAGNGNAGDANEFYLNVYTNIDKSDNFYDCRFDYVPETGSTADFTNVTFDPSDTPVNVTKRGSRIANCPATLEEMPVGSFVYFFTINVGDTTDSDEGLAGYYDNVVFDTADVITTYDFEAPDTAKPVVAIDTPLNEETVPSAFTVTGTASDEDSEIERVDYTVTKIDALGGTFVASIANNTASGTEMWEFDVTDLPTGFYRLKVQAFDTAGNHKFRFHDVFVDANKPAVTITSPVNGAQLEPGVILVTGTAVDEQTAIVEVLYTVTEIDEIGGTYVANVSNGVAEGTEAWSFSTTELPEGVYRLKVQAFDEDGNWRYKFHDVQVAAPLVCAPEVNLLANASFEEPVVEKQRGWDLFDSITGWFSERVAGNGVAQVELQRGVNGWESSDGEQHTELGAKKAITLFQEIPTIEGEAYTLTWDYSPRPGANESENDVFVMVDGEEVGENSGVLPSGNTDWTTHSYSFFGTGETVTVAFSDDGIDNGIGAFLDNTSLVCNPVPEIPFAPYCGDGVIQIEGPNSWEQCEIGDEGCTDYCLFANQCSMEQLVKITLDETDSASFDGMIYLGSDDEVIPNGTWFNFVETGDAAFNTIANNVEGLAVERNQEAEELKLAFVGGNESRAIDIVAGTIETLGITLGSVNEEPNPSFLLETPENNPGAFHDVFEKDGSTITFDLRADTGNDGVAVDINAGMKFNCPECLANVEARVVLQDVEGNFGNLGTGNLEQKVVLGNGDVIEFGEWFDIFDGTDFVTDPVMVESIANPEQGGIFVSRTGDGFVKLALYGDHEDDGNTNHEYIKGRLEFRDAELDGSTLAALSGEYRLENHSETNSIDSDDGFDRIEMSGVAGVEFDFWADTSNDGFKVQVLRDTIDACEDDDSTYLIEGSKWNDENGNGVWDEGEDGIEGWEIYVEGDNSLQTLVTNEDGYYSLEVQAGNYVVFEEDRDGWLQTFPLPYEDDDGAWLPDMPLWPEFLASGYTFGACEYEFGNKDNQIFFAQEMMFPDSGMNPEECNFGNQLVVYTIEGSKWNDENGNGVWDEGEDGIEGWEIYLEGEDASETETTDADGQYSFTVSSGDWTVSEEQREGWLQTAPYDNEEGTCELSLGQLSQGYEFDEETVFCDFGNQQITYTIEGVKWHDEDQNGEYGEAESTLAGWTIQASDGETLMETTTDEFGAYSFTVTSGEWTVNEVQQTGWIQSAPNTEFGTCQVSLGQPKDAFEYSEDVYECNFGNYEEPEDLGPLSCDAFVAADPNADTGSVTTLFWNTSGAAIVSIDNGVGEVGGDGSIQVELPNEETSITYTLTASNNFDETVACETTITTQGSSRGGGGSSSAGIVAGASISIGGDDSEPQVAGESTSNKCGLYLTEYMRAGIANDTEEVNKLQTFLAEQGFFSPVTGVFDPVTTANVKTFQSIHAEQVLLPWFEFEPSYGMSPTGYVFKTTLWKINDIKCPGIGAFPDIP